MQEYYFLHVGTFEVIILQDYCFLPDGTLCDSSKRIFFWSIVCNDCRNTVFHMLVPSLINQNEFSLKVTNAVIARIIFSACWNIVWCIKTNFLSNYCMQWLPEYILFSSCWDILWCIITNFLLKYCRCNDCKNTVFHMLWPSLMN